MIELKNVSFTYPDCDKGSLNDVNLKIKTGECVLLCGRSGCGKTTITRLINGLIPQFYHGNLQGSITMDGKEVLEMPMYQIASKVGSVFQNPRTQFFNVDTDSEIAFGIENEGRPVDELADRVERTAKELQIEKLRKRNIFELSGGEKQKIAFASVYAMNPDIYLLDEPSSNLDMTAIHELREHLKLIKSQGKTIVIAEHRLYYLMDVADRIIYMEEGRIKQIYDPFQFQTLTKEQRHQMGLRAIELAKEKPVEKMQTARKAGLELKDVSVRYKKKTVLTHINLKAGEGEVVAIVGHNGEGKTTFSRSLCGLHKECQGEYLWHGKQVRDKERLKFSYMVMQDVNYELFAESVEAECSFGIKNPDYELCLTTMKKMGLFPLKDRHPNTLSGGQKQRVAVAVSMICKKKLLVFDEPTSGLDYDSMTKVAAIIKELAQAGKIIFVVTHDYEFVCQTCSRVLQIGNGTLLDDLQINSENELKIKRLFAI